MIKYSLILLFIFCIYCPVFSQTTINKQSKMISQVDSLNQIAEKIVRSHPDSTLVLMQKSSELASSINYKQGEGISLMHKSYCISFKGKYAEALPIIEESISILEKTSNKHDLGFAYNQRAHLKERLGDIEQALKDYNKSIAYLTAGSEPSPKLNIVYNSLGGYYERRANHTLSLKYLNKSLELSKQQNDQILVALSLSNMGNIHFFQQEYDKAIPYYKQAIVIHKKIDDDKGLSQTYNNLGGALLSQKKNDKALYYLKEAVLLYKKIGNKRGYLMSQINIGLIYYNKKEYDTAIDYFQESLKMAEATEDEGLLSMIYLNLATSYSDLQSYDSSIVYAQKGLNIAKKINSKRDMINYLWSLSISYEGKKDFKKAHEYHVLYTTHKDSIFNIEKSSEINSLLLEQKKLENVQLEKDNLLKNNALQKEQFERKSQEQELNLLAKQAEADRLLALAKESKNKQKADSLYRTAQNAQLEADNLKIKAEKIEAEKETEKAKSDQKIAFQQNLSILFGIIVLAALAIAFIAYKNQRNKQKSNLLLAEKNEEINLQNELLEQSNQTKDRLFSIVAHDLRSPIAAFQSTSRQINFFLRKNKPEKLQEIGTQIDTSAQHLNNLLNNLLNWVLTQQKQKIQVDKTTQNLYKSIEEVLISYQTIALAHAIEIKNTIPKETSIWVDTDTFQTIIRNLISNSLKYTPEKGSISLSVVAQNIHDETVVLKITDTGIGMSEEIKNKLSSEFMQLDLNHRERGLRGEKSTGLGLLLCYEFAALNDIEINLESKQNEGTTFYLKIPKKQI